MKSEYNICIGVTKENQVVFTELNFNKDYFSITHTTLRELITSDEGEQRGREYLEDGDLWKQAVEGNNTTSSLEDWIEEVLNVDGWEHVLDSRYFGDFENTSYYSMWDSFGASIEDFKKEFSLMLISKEDLDLIIESDKLHLKDYKKYNKKDKILLAKLKELATKYESQKDYESKVIEHYLNNKE